MYTDMIRKGITIKDVYKENTVVHCETRDEAERILKLADAQGWMWISKQSYRSHSRWGDYKADTCYNFWEGTFCDMAYFIDYDYTIVPSINIVEEDDFLREIALVAMQGLLSADTSVKFKEIIKEDYAKLLVQASFAIANEFLRQEKYKEEDLPKIDDLTLINILIDRNYIVSKRKI